MRIPQFIAITSLAVMGAFRPGARANARGPYHRQQHIPERASGWRITHMMIACGMLLGSGSLGLAQAQQPTSEEIIQKLQPNSEIAPTPTLRELPWTRKGLRPAEPSNAPPSIDLHVPFEYDSDKLSPDAMLILQRLGAALDDHRLASFRFKIAGHTDAKGTADYNQRLSERRAQAVLDYLVSKYGLQTNRLETVGYGKSQLADPARPEDGINRRVQIINIGRFSESRR